MIPHQTMAMLLIGFSLIVFQSHISKRWREDIYELDCMLTNELVNVKMNDDTLFHINSLIAEIKKISRWDGLSAGFVMTYVAFSLIYGLYRFIGHYAL